MKVNGLFADLYLTSFFFLSFSYCFFFSFHCHASFLKYRKRLKASAHQVSNSDKIKRKEEAWSSVLHKRGAFRSAWPHFQAKRNKWMGPGRCSHSFLFFFSLMSCRFHRHHNRRLRRGEREREMRGSHVTELLFLLYNVYDAKKKKPLFDTMSFHTKLKEKAGKYFVMLFAFFL